MDLEGLENPSTDVKDQRPKDEPPKNPNADTM